MPLSEPGFAAAIGLIPAAVATGIDAQAQRPLARVVVGGMLTSAALILLVLPILYRLTYRWTQGEAEQESRPEYAATRLPAACLDTHSFRTSFGLSDFAQIVV